MRRKKQERIPPRPNQRLWTGSPAFTNEYILINRKMAEPVHAALPLFHMENGMICRLGKYLLFECLLSAVNRLIFCKAAAYHKVNHLTV